MADKVVTAFPDYCEIVLNGASGRVGGLKKADGFVKIVHYNFPILHARLRRKATGLRLMRKKIYILLCEIYPHLFMQFHGSRGISAVFLLLEIE